MNVEVRNTRDPKLTQVVSGFVPRLAVAAAMAHDYRKQKGMAWNAMLVIGEAAREVTLVNTEAGKVWRWGDWEADAMEHSGQWL